MRCCLSSLLLRLLLKFQSRLQWDGSKTGLVVNPNYGHCKSDCSSASCYFHLCREGKWLEWLSPAQTCQSVLAFSL